MMNGVTADVEAAFDSSLRRALLVAVVVSVGAALVVARSWPGGSCGRWTGSVLPLAASPMVTTPTGWNFPPRRSWPHWPPTSTPSPPRSTPPSAVGCNRSPTSPTSCHPAHGH